MSERFRGARLTRRRALALGAAGAVTLVAGAYGRFAVGDEFEEHVAATLDISRDAVERLLGNARQALGTAGYDARAAAFVAVTTWPGADLVPESARREAIDALVLPMYADPEDNLVVLGIRERYIGACGGLLRR
jgi:hypothetical protein